VARDTTRSGDDTRDPTDQDLRAQEAAYLRGQYGMSQDEIAKVLGVNQPRVSRLLERAKAMKCFEEVARFVRTPNISEERMEAIRALLAPPDLRAALDGVASATGVTVRNVRVLESGIRSDPTEEQADAALRKFGRTAAGRIEELIRESHVFAVAWGRTLGLATEHLSESRFHVDRQPILFVPVCADPRFPTRFSSTRLADDLNSVVNGGRGERLSLAGIPDFFRRRFKGKNQVIREFSEYHASYRRIFASQRPLINRVDSILTGIGYAERPLGHRNQGLLTMGELSASELRELVVGDIGGVLIPRPGLNAGSRRRVENLNAMWTGIRLDHFTRIAKQAARSGKPGVIVVAIGRRKAETLAEIIRCGLANELIVDEDLSAHLGTRLRTI
jgi:DNA-binding transcriptional regulator LsrR (DeoR family)